MHRLVLIGASLVPLSLSVPAHATVAVNIDLTHQKMHVQSSSGSYDWAISSARSGFYTPGGSFAPTHLEVMHYSHKYHMSPMPHAIFFRGGYAIHGTYAVGSLGRPASHGCVRLAPGNAALLFSMVKSEGARISISGTPPQGTVHVARAERPIARPAGRPIVRADVGASEPSRGAEPSPAAGLRGPRAARLAREASDYSAMGYHYIGRVNGHRLYQQNTPTSGGFFGDSNGVN